jgi:hypothetical protein
MASGTEIFEAQKRSILTATTNIKTKRGKVCRVIVASSTSLRIAIYDHPSSDTNLIWDKTVSTGDIYTLMCPMENGIRATVVSGSGQFVVTWS